MQRVAVLGVSTKVRCNRESGVLGAGQAGSMGGDFFQFNRLWAGTWENRDPPCLLLSLYPNSLGEVCVDLFLLLFDM